MAVTTIDNGSINSYENVGYYTRSTTVDLSLPTGTSAPPVSWNGNTRLGVYSLGWAICEESGGINLYAKVGFSGYGGSGTSSVLALPAYSASPPVKAFAVGPVYFTKSNTTAFNLTVNVYTNSGGTTRPDNLYNTAANDDTRMAKRSATSGDYYATLSYYTVPDAPTSVTAAAQATPSNSPTLTFTAPGTGGAPGGISSYTALWQTTDTWSTAGGWSSVASFTSGSVVSGTFSSNTTYYFRVIATSAVGDSPYSTSSSWYYRTVTINANNGSAPSTTTFYPNNGGSITLPAATTRAGYTFGGWNTNSAGTGTTYAAGSSYTAAGDVTLYAKWTPNTPKIYNGTAFVAATGSKIYNGTAWVTPTFKVWNGTTWADPT